MNRKVKSPQVEKKLILSAPKVEKVLIVHKEENKTLEVIKSSEYNKNLFDFVSK